MSIQAEGTTSESSDMSACLLVLGTSGKPCGWSGVEGWSVSESEMRSELTGQEDAQSTCGLEGLYKTLAFVLSTVESHWIFLSRGVT